LCNRIPFLGLAIIPLLGPPDRCRQLGIVLVLAIVGMTRMPAALGTPAWWSWMGDLVPERRRSRFFSCRQQTASAATGISLILGMGLWSFSANLVMPFLPVYQRGEMIAGHQLGLGISWFYLAALTVAASFAGMLTSRRWGQWIERMGPHRLLLLGSGYLFVN